MKHTYNIFKVIIGILSIIPIFYPNKYTYGIWTLFILFEIIVELRKKPKKSVKYICIFCGFAAIVLYYYYLVKNQ
ncbi:hypothetical protein [Clostridium sp. LCP25S3_F8]|uniref:hypothetical protein n=1 Tax=Clostridium sp. LCP25S3_F8 TaxID=3438751 RepID=UPI003F910EB3